MCCPLVGFDCVAQPTTKQAKAPASARLRHLGIEYCALNTSPDCKGQAEYYRNPLGTIIRFGHHSIAAMGTRHPGYVSATIELPFVRAQSCNGDNAPP